MTDMLPCQMGAQLLRPYGIPELRTFLCINTGAVRPPAMLLCVQCRRHGCAKYIVVIYKQNHTVNPLRRTSRVHMRHRQSAVR